MEVLPCNHVTYLNMYTQTISTSSIQHILEIPVM